MSKPDPQTTAATVPPWELPPSHPDNLLIEIGILKQSVGWLGREVEKLIRERADARC